MKKSVITILSTLLVVLVQTITVRAEMATVDEALCVAKNWVTLIIQKEGNWGGFEWADVQGIQEFKRGQRIIGYFCRVKPIGYIVVSLRKELAPVKAYSATCDLDPEIDVGLTDLIKLKMENILNGIEKQLGPIKAARTQDVIGILEINYRPAWYELAVDIRTFKEGLASGEIEIEMNYQEGQVLLSSSWHQEGPYNRQCPAPPPDDDCTLAHCAVGCVPLAGAQVMRYWAWPPGYDWANMPDRLTAASPQTQIDAVARLCHEVGVEAGADYCGGETSPCATGACFASCIGKDLLDTFEDHFQYSDSADDRAREDYTAIDWFNEIKSQLNLNRPIPYRVKDHVIVCDGWQEIGGGPTRQYHMNYGWDDIYNAWYTLDALHLGGEHEERMLIQVYPNLSLGWSLGDDMTYTGYRYFDRDASGSNVTFLSGDDRQFLPGIKVTSASGFIRFEGTSAGYTQLFSVKGTATGGRVATVKMYSGVIEMYQNGSIRFHE